jgi:hypothetical protein
MQSRIEFSAPRFAPDQPSTSGKRLSAECCVTDSKDFAVLRVSNKTPQWEATVIQ